MSICVGSGLLQSSDGCLCDSDGRDLAGQVCRIGWKCQRVCTWTAVVLDGIVAGITIVTKHQTATSRCMHDLTILTVKPIDRPGKGNLLLRLHVRGRWGVSRSNIDQQHRQIDSRAQF